MTERERFNAWVRGRSQGCMSDDEISGILATDCEDPSEYVDQSVQAQWEAWKAALEFEVAYKRKSSYSKNSRTEYSFVAGDEEYIIEACDSTGMMIWDWERQDCGEMAFKNGVWKWEWGEFSVHAKSAILAYIQEHGSPLTNG